MIIHTTVLLCLLSLTLAAKYDHVKPFFSPNAIRNYTIRVERNLCVDQPYKNFELLTCTHRLVRNQPSRTYFAGRFLSRQEVVLCHYQVFYRFLTYQLYQIDEWFNYCEEYDSIGKGSRVGRLTVGSLKSSFPDLPGCPLEGLLNVTYQINEAQFPPFLPAGEYRLDMKFFNGQNETLFAIQTFLSVRTKGAVELKMG